MTIEEWIAQQEGDRSLTIEQFYARLKDAASELQDRLSAASDDGVDLNDLDLDDTG